MLVTGLALTAGYAVIVLMTMYWPSICRRSSATWTLAVTIVVFFVWLAAKQFYPNLPDAIFFTLPASLLTFLLVPLIDQRRLQ
jgi:SSS family solute:Na+ symporter